MTVRGLLVRLAVLASLAACHRVANPVAPSPTGSVAPPPIIYLPPVRPTIGRSYVFLRPLTYPVTAGTRNSRYVFLDGTRFAMRYDRPDGGFAYYGSYSMQEDGRIRLLFDANPWLPWAAIAWVNADVLSVDCNEMMEWSDFEDAVYAAEPP